MLMFKDTITGLVAGVRLTSNNKIPKGDWTVIARDGSIKADGLGTTRGGRITVEPVSALILARTK